MSTGISTVDFFRMVNTMEKEKWSTKTERCTEGVGRMTRNTDLGPPSMSMGNSIPQGMTIVSPMEKGD